MVPNNRTKNVERHTYGDRTLACAVPNSVSLKKYFGIKVPQIVKESKKTRFRVLMGFGCNGKLLCRFAKNFKIDGN